MELILVTGGTGTLGRILVERLAARSHPVRVLSRRPAPAAPGPAAWAAGDLRQGHGIAAAVTDVDVIVHCATGLGDARAARHLINAARQAGQPHLVYISIVGIDRVPFGYYKAKLAVERQIEDCGLPWTIQRTTQFHNLILRACQALARLPVLPVPASTCFQPVDATEVAGRLAELATGPPAGRVPDMGGPQVLGAADLARSYLAARRHRRPVVPLRVPGRTAAAFRHGGHLTPGHAVGRVTFDQFLAARFGPDGQPRPATAPPTD